MREMGIRACYIKPYVKTTFDSDFSTKLHNILKRDFSPSKPNEAWCTDITYIFTLEGFVYLTSVMDLYSRKIIAWTLSRTLEVEEVLKCIEMARKRRKTANPVIIHSDRGVHYTSKLYKKLTAGLILSYSKKGTPWDNACIESFHSVIKREWLNRTLIYDYDHAYDLCFEYIETFYNTILFIRLYEKVQSYFYSFSPEVDNHEMSKKAKYLNIVSKDDSIFYFEYLGRTNKGEVVEYTRAYYKSEVVQFRFNQYYADF